MFKQGERVRVVRVARGMDRAMIGLLGKVVGPKHEDALLPVRIDNTPEHGQYAGRTLLFLADELGPLEFKPSSVLEVKLGKRVRIVRGGSPVFGKWGTVTYIKPSGQIEVTVGLRAGRMEGWFTANELQVMA